VTGEQRFLEGVFQIGHFFGVKGVGQTSPCVPDGNL
jgi:hypothetical protein